MILSLIPVLSLIHNMICYINMYSYINDSDCINLICLSTRMFSSSTNLDCILSVNLSVKRLVPMSIFCSALLLQLMYVEQVVHCYTLFVTVGTIQYTARATMTATVNV